MSPRDADHQHAVARLSGDGNTWRIAGALVALLLTTALLAAGCVGQSSPTPASHVPDALSSAPPGGATRPPTATVRPTPSAPHADLGCAALVASKPSPYPDPTIPPPPSPTIAASDAQSVAAITAATDALAALRSYRLSVDVVGLSIADLQPVSLDLSIRGTVSHADGFAMDALVGTRMREPDGSAAISGGAQYVAGNGYVWATGNVSGMLEPVSSESVVSSMVVLAPEGLARRAVVPFAGGYRRVGTEMRGGIETVHFRASMRGTEAYAATFRFPGTVTADVWIASEGGELTEARIAGSANHRDPSSGSTVDDSVLIAFVVTDPGSAGNVVELPAAPLADPVRPTGPPVDLRLEYQVTPSNGTSPTGADLSAIGVALRTRLDISARPVKVEVVGQDRLVVTVCGTTHPDEDRRLVVATGALTVVPLPAADYGTTTNLGRRDLPTVGGLIDAALYPVAPAAGLGLTTAHVDPTTGRRGLAFRLGNKASDAFRAYATAHPGEYVAIVLDGVVLASLPIEGATAAGNFVFTGDYTEAESRLLASYLYRDPISFVLRPTGDVEIPTR